MVEGSLWVYGHTDLMDYYRDRLTLRQVYARLACLPRESPFMQLQGDLEAQSQADQQVADVQAVLDQFKR